MKPVCCIELVSVGRTFVLDHYQKRWQSSLQYTVCDSIQARVNPDGSIDIRAEFESNGGINMTITHMPAVIIWTELE
jgi:hypothetical protein